MAYAYATILQASQELGNRLFDSTGVFWTDVERRLYITEALREWNAMANFWRAEFTFQSQAGVVWYDLTDVANLPNTLRPFTVTLADLYNIIEYHLLEPVVGAGPWTGSSQFTIADIVAAVQRRRDEILSTVGCTVSRQVVNAAPGRTYLADTVIDIRRVAWLPQANLGFSTSPLWPGDTWEEQSFNPGFTVAAPGIPSLYMQSAQPPLSFDTDVPPIVPGQYECLVIGVGPAVLNIPDDWVWILKWGALADLLSRDSDAKDELRAKYCEARYQQGLALLAAAPSLLAMRINNIPLQVGAAQDEDNWNPGWQGVAQKQPERALTAGLNLIGLSATPDAGYAMTATVIENAPIPVVDGDFIQLGRDDYDVLIDEAQHIASFKQGGQEFIETLPLHERFIQQATIYNSKLSELGSFQRDLYELSQLHDKANPRMTPNE